ncbi:MAG: hypothetical protein VX741_04410, partial [Pseudomonadota bacterium]|nr:hypothetical protein [Pseudomonadota bacterium]
MPDTPEITASKTPDISVAPPISTSEQGMKQYLDAAEIRFDRYEDIFAKYKLTQAARFLKHFRSGSGAEVGFTLKEARNFEPIRSAESGNREQFETGAFLAKANRNKKNNEILRKLKDGDKPVDMVDHYEYIQRPDRSVRTALSSGPKSYLSFGNTHIRSTATFTVWRVGNIIHYLGTVTHKLNDPFD